MTIASDQSLLLRYATSRDAEAFTELVRRYSGMVFAVARRVTGSASDAEDVAQECFFELAKTAGRMPTALPAWLHRIAMHRAIDHVRASSARHQRVATSESAVAAATTAAPSAVEDGAWKELSPFVDAALEALPEELRTPLILHFFQDRSQEETAEALGIPRRTISRRIQDGIAALRDELRKHGISGEMSLLPSVLLANASPPAPTALVMSLKKIGLAGIGGATAATGISMWAALGGALAVLAVLGSGIGLYFQRGGQRGGAAPDESTPVSPVSSDQAAAPLADAKPVAHRDILLIGGDHADDRAVVAHLAGRGLAARSVRDAAAVAADADGCDLVLVSQSVYAERMSGKLRASRAPIIVWEPGLWQDLGMIVTGAVDLRDQTALRIIDPAHPLAAGLSGLVTVSGAPARMSTVQGPLRAGHIVASPAARPDLIALFAYAPGEALVDGLPAAGKRVGFFLYDQGRGAITVDGWRLFDAAVDWCLAKEAGVSSGAPANDRPAPREPGDPF